MPLFLIGYRGTGKTTVAQIVAERLGWQWLDTDVEIERQSARAIAQIFAESGEVLFRDWETRVLEEATARQQTVIALGGGIVLAERNRGLLRRGGRTVWLTARPETLWKRIAQDATTAGRRPNLTAGGGLGEIEQILADRLPLYRECADWVVDTEDKSPAEVAHDILALAAPTAPLDSA
jgi:shikimate kinase